MEKTSIIIKEFARVIFGLIVFSYGVHLTIAANIGVAPWDCFAQGIAKHAPFNFGIAVTVISIFVLFFDLLLKEPVGYGMIFDALVTGSIIQLFNDYDSFANNLVSGFLHLEGIPAILMSCVMMVAGMFFMAIGQVLYIGAGQTCGPRDSLTVGLGKKFPKVPIGLIQNGILAIVFAAGWLLGGSVGIGTLLGAFGTGLVMEFVFRAMHFEPRDIRHRSFMETTSILFGKQ